MHFSFLVILSRTSPFFSHSLLFSVVNEKVKHTLGRKYELKNNEFHFFQSFAGGACGGLAFWTLTYPFDVIKATMQSKETLPFISITNAKNSILRSYGYKGFLRGFLPCIIRAIPACGMMFVAVDFIRSQFSDFHFSSPQQQEISRYSKSASATSTSIFLKTSPATKTPTGATLNLKDESTFMDYALNLLLYLE